MVLTNKQCVYERNYEGEKVITAINADENSFTASFNMASGNAVELISGKATDISGGVELPPYSVMIFKLA